MESTDQMQTSEPQEEYFVEVLGHDGLAHHVGPFKSIEQAQEWIAQNSPDDPPRPDQIQQKLPAADSTGPRLV